MSTQEEENSLTKEKENVEKDKEINEQEPLNTFEIIQFESNRPKPTSKNKYTTIIIFCIFIVLIAIVTLYFLNKSDLIFNEDTKLFILKIRKEKKTTKKLPREDGEEYAKKRKKKILR